MAYVRSVDRQNVRRVRTCETCPAEIVTTGTKKQARFCDACKLERKTESSRKSGQKQLRKNGIVPHKGSFIQCARCGCDVQRDGVKRLYCEPCNEIVKSETSRAAANRRRLREGVEYKEVIRTCTDCRQDFTVLRALDNARKYCCPVCIAKRKADTQAAEADPSNVRITACADCECEIRTPGSKKVKIYCEPCRKKRKRESARIAMSKQRLKRGVVPVKGTMIRCECGTEFIRNGIARKFCETCQPLNILKRARMGVHRKMRERGAVPIGTILVCKHCKCDFPKDATRTCYCTDCRKLQKAGKLPSLRASMAAWRKKQHAENPKWSMNSRMRSGIRHSLGTRKAGRPWESLVDYTVLDLMRHLERCFLPGMTWENRGEWEIDHIQPLASFNYTSAEDRNFKAAWCLSNLRPLWKTDNYEKRAKRTHLL